MLRKVLIDLKPYLRESKVPFFTKKPITIEARQFDYADPIRAKEIADWCKAVNFELGDRLMYIVTDWGIVIAGQFDWIIKGIKGKFYPCDNETFEATYDEN